MKRALQIIFSIILILLGIFYFAIEFKKCEGINVDHMNKVDSLEIQNTLLKRQISEGLKQRDSILKNIPYRDSVITVYKDRWHKAKDTFSNIEQMPCDSVKKEVPKLIAACDSLHEKDSLLINDLKNTLDIDKGLFADYEQHINNDSIIKQELKQENATLKKKVRRKTVEARVSQGIGLIGWILAFLK